MVPLLELRGVSKHYGPTIALSAFDFDLQAGEVHALVGENGAGKSTALGLMYGVNLPDAGSTLVAGEPIALTSIGAAQAAGVSCVFQELSLAEGLTVAENIFAGRAPTRAGLIDWSALRSGAQALLDGFDLDIDVEAPVRDLPVGARQVVEIAKALSLNARVLLLDEPTSALSPEEKASLFRLIKTLTARGIGIVYVSHHMSEVLQVADRITVLRDGRKISCRQAYETTEVAIVEDMVGRALGDAPHREAQTNGETVLALEGVDVTGILDGIDLHVRAGEIVGLAGLLGSGAATVGEVIAGLVRPSAGSMTLRGEPFAPRSFRGAMRRGIGFVPQERKTEGLFIEMPLRGNIVVASMQQHTRFGLLHEKLAKRASEAAITRFSIRTAGDLAPVTSLSGGNQQKVLLAKWFQTNPSVLVVNEPTKGVDVRSKRQIHAALESTAEHGTAVIVISSDFPELLAISDRLLVMRHGRIATSSRAATESDLIALASGGKVPSIAEVNA
jgi:ribose transport system ATP-binding protein